MSEPKKKSAKQRNIDKIVVTRAVSELAKAAEDFVDELLECEMCPSHIPIRYYTKLIEAKAVLSNRRRRQRCSLVADGWPRTDDGGYIYDDITIASCYEKETHE